VALILAFLASPAAFAVSIGGLPGGTPKTAPKPLILYGLQRYEADRHGVYQFTTAIADDNPGSIAVDANGKLYVGNGGTNTITIYPQGGSTGSMPNAVIAGPDTGLTGVGPLAADPKGNLFTLSNGLVLLKYAAGSIGNTVPSMRIPASPQVLTDPVAITVDSKDNIYVANQLGTAVNKVVPGSIVIFGARSGAVPKTTISGAATGIVTPRCVAVDSAGKIYVANDGSIASNVGLGPDTSSIVVFKPGSSGNIKPIATISGFATGLGQTVTGLAVDGAGNIYVSSILTILAPVPTPVPRQKTPSGAGKPASNYTQYQIQSFAAGSNGNVAPIATIAGDATGLYNTDGGNGIAVSAAGEIYSANAGANSVTVYAPGSSGNVSPVATLSRGDAGVGDVMGVAFDKAGNIYGLQRTAETTDSISEWAAGSTDSPPLRTLDFPPPVDNTPLGLAVDTAGNIYVGMPPPSGGLAGGSLLEFAAGSEGNAQPARTISGSNTGIGLPTAIAVDQAGNAYVSSWSDSGGVSVFSPSDDGNATPSQLIAGADTEIFTPESIAVDSKGTIYVGNSAAAGPNTIPQVTIYAPEATDDTAPQAALPAVFGSTGLAVDTGGNLYVANASTVEVFPPGANAKTKPQTLISFSRGGPTFAMFPTAQP